MDAGHLFLTLHCQVAEDDVEQRGAVDADTGAWVREISTPSPQGEHEPCSAWENETGQTEISLALPRVHPRESDFFPLCISSVFHERSAEGVTHFLGGCGLYSLASTRREEMLGARLWDGGGGD